MRKPRNSRVIRRVIPLLVISFAFLLGVAKDPPVATSQENARKFTGRASITVDDLAEPGKTYGGLQVLESSAELTIDNGDVVRGTIRFSHDSKASSFSCGERKTIVTTLYGRMIGELGTNQKPHIIGDSSRSERVYTTKVDRAQKQQLRCEDGEVVERISYWWGKFDDETTISIYLSPYPTIAGFVGRVKAAGETKRRIETYVVCNGKSTAAPGVSVNFFRKGSKVQTITTGPDGKGTGYFGEDQYQVYVEEPSAFLHMDHLEDGGGGSPVSATGFLKQISEGTTYNPRDNGYVTIPNWDFGVLKVYFTNWVAGEDCDRRKKPPPPIVLGDPGRTVKLIKLKGDVGYIARGPQAEWQDVTEGMKLSADFQIHTGPDSEVTIETPDGAHVVIKDLTMIEMTSLIDQRSRIMTEVLLKMGELKAQVRPQQVIRADFSVQTPTAVAGVRGTTFGVRYNAKTRTTTVTVEEGEVSVTPQNPALKAFSINAMQQVEVAAGNVSPIRGASTATGTTPQVSSPGTEGGSTLPPTVSGGKFQWVGIGNGDCGGNDIGQTIGVKLPEAAQCNANSVGVIAVCWDGSVFANPSRAGQWCTYKSKAANPCRGGSNQGPMYECRASSKLPPDEYTLPPTTSASVTWATQANQLGGQTSQRFTVACPRAGQISDRLWGTDLYTNDSSICAAAVHAGLINTAAGGMVTIELLAGAASYRGSTRQGVTSKDYGAWGGSFAFVRSGSKYPKDEYTIPPDATQATWGTQANQLGGKVGQRFTLVCPPAGEISGRLWGSDLYTDDSSICTAAAHSGLITVAGGGTVTIELRPGASAYKGTSRNGVTTKDFGAWPASFVFIGQSGVRPTAFPKDDYYLPPFNGTWDAWGDMVLTQNGNNVAGTYSVGPGGEIQGTASYGALRFSWTRRDGGSPGEAFLTIKPDGSIEGRWCTGKGCDPSNGSPFSGRRKQ